MILSHYSQPEFHRFAQDSLEFARFLEEEILPGKKDISCLDLCAGCGVIGLELVQRFPFQFRMDFSELQKEFKEHFEANRSFLSKKGLDFEGDFILGDFRLFPERKYDYIFSNPPYYCPNSGKTSPDERKRLCRFFSKDDWSDFFSTLERLLKEGGKAYFLSREKAWEEDERVKALGLLSGSQIFCFDLDVE